MDSGPPSQIYFAREPQQLRAHRRASQAEFNYQRAGATRPVHALQGQRRRHAVELRAPRRVRAALRQPRPADLGPDQLRHQAAAWSATSAPASTKLAPFLQFDADPYPVVLGDRTVWVMDGYTTTDQYPYSQALGGEGALAGVVQLRAQLGEGHRRRVRGHGHVLRVRREGPDHPGVAQGVPRPLHRRVATCPRSSGSTSGTPKTCSRCRPTMFGRYHVTEPQPLLRRQRQRGWSRPTPARVAVSSDLLSEATARRQPATAAASNQPQAATSTGAPHRPVLPVHQAPGRDAASTSSSSCRSCRCRRATARRAWCRSSPRDSDPGQYGKLQSFTMPQGRDRRGPGTGEQRHHPHRGDRPGDHAAQPAGLADHPGEPAADPGRQLDHLRAAVLRAGPQRGQLPAVPVRGRVLQGYGAVLRADGARRASTRCSATRQPSTTCNRSGGSAVDGHRRSADRRPRPPTTEPTATTRVARPRPRVPPPSGDGAGPPQPGGGQARRRPTAALDDNDLGAYQRLVNEAQRRW